MLANTYQKYFWNFLFRKLRKHILDDTYNFHIEFFSCQFRIDENSQIIKDGVKILPYRSKPLFLKIIPT